MDDRTRWRRTVARASVLALAAGTLIAAAPAQAHAGLAESGLPESGLPESGLPASGTVTTAGTGAGDLPAPTEGAVVDWFDDSYDALGPGSVFETVTFERFEYLLKKDTGRWAFVIGGPDEQYLQSTIGHIDAVAKAAGVERIYNFDPALDGDDLSVFDLTGSPLHGAPNAGKEQFLALGQRLVADYLGKDAETPFRLASDASRPDQRVADGHPYLFVYDAAGGERARIVDALTVPPSSLATPEAITAYRADVRRVLTSAPLDVDTQWDFLSTEHNRRHHERYVRNADAGVEASNRARFGGDIFDAADDLPNLGTAAAPRYDEDDFRIESITYPELINVLDSDGDFVILFGGTWCHNTAAIIKQTAQYAREHGIRRVYNFDFSLDSTGNSGALDKHIRDNALRNLGTTAAPNVRHTRPAHLYGEILQRLSNATTQYKVSADEAGTQALSPVRYYDRGVTPDPAAPARDERLARKIQVGHVLSYNREARRDGAPAPVLDQAIRSDWTNPETGSPAAPQYAGNLEYMTEWWFTAAASTPFDAADPDRLRGNVNVTAESGQNALRNQRAFAREALSEIRDVIAGVAGGYDAELAVQREGGSVAAGRPSSLTAQVEVETAFDGFASTRTASGSNAGTTLAPGSTTVPLGGEVEVYVDDTRIGAAAVGADRRARVALTLPALSAGSHTLRYVYAGGAGGRVAATERSEELQVVGEASTTTLSGPERVGFGAGATLTAQVGDGATGTVRLEGLPSGALEREVSGGRAVFEVPGSTAAGSYRLRAVYSGDATRASSSDEADLEVARALTIVRASSASGYYGTSGRLAVEVISPTASVTGQVRISGVGAAQTKALVGGRANFALPRGLAAKRHSVRVDYLGDADRNVARAQVSYTVAKARPARVATSITRRPTTRAAGRATVRVSTASGLRPATGTVRVTLRRGSVSKAVSARVNRGSATVVLPRLAAGTWTVSTQYRGDSHYLARAGAGVRLQVR